MMTLLRRILLTALIGGLAGLGVITALLGRRQRNRAAVQTEDLTPVAAPAPIERKRGGGRRAALAFAGLLLVFGLTGLIDASRDVPSDSAAPSRDFDRNPLLARSGPVTGTNSRPVVTDEMATGSLRMSEPGAPASANTSPPTSVPPDFNILRVEPNAGGKPTAETRTDAGQDQIRTSPALPTGSSDIDRRAREAGDATPHSPAPVASISAPHRNAELQAVPTSPVKPTESGPKPDNTTAPGPAQGSSSAGPRTENDAQPGHEKPLRAGNTAPSAAALLRHQADSARTGLGTQPSRAGSDTASEPIQPTPDLHASGATDNATGDSKPTGPKVNSIATAQDGRLRVTVQAAPGADLRSLVNGTLIAPAIVGPDGTVTFSLDHVVAPRDSTIGLERVDPATGQLVDHADIPFAALGKDLVDGADALAAGQVGPRALAGSGANDRRATTDLLRRDETAQKSSQSSETGSLYAGGPAGADAKSSDVHTPRVETIRIVRGDNLWVISRRTYGHGNRYPVIYAANRQQIRDPDLIYPGQILVLPRANAATAKTTQLEN